MKPSLQLKLSQHLALTPQLQQSIKLLQLSTLELNQEIEKILLENPMIERDEPESNLGSSRLEAPGPAAPAGSEAAQEREQEQARESDQRERDTDREFDFAEGGDWQGSGSGSRDDDDDNDFQDLQATVTTLRDHLDAQIALTQLSDRDRALTRFMIEALDDDGYLSQALEDLLPLLPPELEVDLDDLTIALRHIQSLDPCGIGAADISECLGLQLRAEPPSCERELALAIVAEHLELLAARDYLKLKRALRCTDDELREAHALILDLNPRPGARFAQSDIRYVVPDVIVRKVRSTWVVNLNPDAMPKLRINQLYAQILRDNRGASGSLSNHLQEARWLIKNVQQRFDTIQRVSQAIVDRQRQFFDYGDVAMRPLTLREIAEQLELHESTVSRVTTQKYMATPRGIFEFKHFFGSHVATDTGGAASSTAIRALIRQLVAAEDKKKPLSDAKIAELLGQQGIVVARRTIAKYRESLDIPPVSLRKTI
jgi:RNA polymerase sigma-54 factor